MKTATEANAARYRVETAGAEGIVSAQRLRYRVFVEELGARLPDTGSGLDRDRYDPHCRHLLVRDLTSGEIVACTRALNGPAAASAGGFYSHAEFEFGKVLDRPGRYAEIGRTCVAPAYRNGAVIATLWQGIGELVHRERIDFLFGCASVPLAPDPAAARAILHRLHTRHLTSPDLRVRPRRPLAAQPATTAENRTPRMPPLLRAYLSLGAKACGEPCWDPDFNVADVFMLLDLGELEPRYERHFISLPAAGRGEFARA